ncbi:alpha/beta hydrolase [Cellulosimicrobium terreum]|nr:alpha/beta hydrolase [Cellulosimicrobium terreum]
MVELDLPTPDGRVLHAYDRSPLGADPGDERLVVVWHHGTPNIGPPPAPLFDLSDRLGIRWVGYDRPGYGGSTPHPDRSVASAADDVAAVADALGVGRFAVFGHSGGGPHALACAALLPDRVTQAVVGGCLAPYEPSVATGLDWFGGMASGSVLSLGAAVEGREAREAFAASGTEGELGFSDSDLDALHAEWSWFDSVVGPAVASGPAPAVDDDLAYVRRWGFDVSDVTVPTLVLQGGLDRMVPPTHGLWIAEHVPGAALRLLPDAGHVSVLRSGAAAALTALAR